MKEVLGQEPVPDEQQITSILANLLLQPKLAPSAITLAGEIIAIDGRLMEYGSAMIAGSMTEISNRFEAYFTIASRTGGVVGRYCETHDNQVLIRELSEIKEVLANLS
ncbi:MAG TPA: hypothetical protein VG900_16270 [Hyphomicrobiaceae bacterium]|nr:hypothetical protein [Hyphomicrobiaceae bacterium]